MPKEDEKVKELDDLFLQCEQLKDMILVELGKLGESLNGMVQKMGGNDPAKFKTSLGSLKSFLQSSSSMMGSLDSQVKQITNDITKLKTFMDQVGMMCRS